MKNINRQATIILLIITVFSVIIFSLCWYGMDKISNPLHIGICFVSYLLLFVFLNFLNKRFPKIKIIQLITTVVSIPFGILFIVTRITLPFMAILGYSMCFFLFVGIVPALLLGINDSLSIIIISRETFLFLFLTISAIIATSCFKIFIKITDKYSILREEIKKAEINELIHHIFTLKNIRFCIYVVYFIYIIIYSIKFLNNEYSLKLSMTDNAIMQSFFVYLAYDNVINNISKISFSPAVFLRKVLHSIFQSDGLPNEEKEIEENNDKNTIK